MKALVALAVGATSLLASGAALAQAGNMMDRGSGMWGGGWMGEFGGLWVPVLLLAAVVFLVLWIFKQRDR